MIPARGGKNKTREDHCLRGFVGVNADSLA
jgi:hypothetical protein